MLGVNHALGYSEVSWQRAKDLANPNPPRQKQGFRSLHSLQRLSPRHQCKITAKKAKEPALPILYASLGHVAITQMQLKGCTVHREPSKILA